MKALILFGCLCVAISALNVQQSAWDRFKIKYGKSYTDPEEDERRMNIFFENKALVDDHRKRQTNGVPSYSVALNKFADLTNEEFKAKYANLKPNMTRPPATFLFKFKSDAQIPESIDWRSLGAVTDVKEQGDCGACYSFSATGSIEGQHQITTGNLVSLSEQELIDCSEYNRGCDGGNMENSYNYVIKRHGLDTESSYKYTAQTGQCKADEGEIGASIRTFALIPGSDEIALTQAIGTVGPISISINSEYGKFRFYTDGVFDDPGCSPFELDHGVLAVGYGTLDDKEYYIIKNSWGTSWGKDGYVLMSRNKGNQCGVASLASYPIAK